MRLSDSRDDVITETEAPALVEVARLGKRYGEQRALADISFSVRAGEVLGVIGPNGAGKTTLLEAIAGLLPVDAGEVLWRGAPLAPAHRRACVFYLPDGLRPWEDQFTVGIIEFFAAAYRRSDDFVAEIIATLGLAPVLRKRARALSKGYARRLLMDEPFDGFDLRQTREIMVVLRKIAAGGRTLLLAIHQLADAERVCDRFVLLADGRPRGIGTLAELSARTGQDRLEEVFLALT
jgi:ABC-type multidrug transport system ATPase subunit